jgi:DNA repair photolyase
MQIRLVQAKTILNPSKLSRGYTLNPYLGCTHGCVYCYNQNFIQRLRPKDKWGRFMEVKVNAPDILEKEIKKKPRGSVFLSTVTDPYNPLESKYQLTRECLKMLIENKWPVSILTKSDLVLRDLDLFRQLPRKVEIGFTITTVGDKTAKIIEPGAPLPSQRIKALAALKAAGIGTYVFVAPVLPKLTNLPLLFSTLRNKTDEIWFDTLNTRAENWRGLRNIIVKHWPEYVALYEKLFFQEREKYQQNLKKEIRALSRVHKIPVKIYIS